MSQECLSFREIPHTSALFHYFLFEHSRVAAFYPHEPTVGAVEGFAKTLITENSSPNNQARARHQRVAAILEAQNRSFGASPKTLANLERLKNGAIAVLSGQQVGLFGGPLYSILKAASAVQLATELTAKGMDAVPVFWLATEDHDLAEINHTFLPVTTGEPREFVSTSRTAGVPPVGPIPFTAEIDALAAEAAALLPPGEAAEVLKSCYREGESYGSAFAKLFAWIFREHGLILLDPLDAALHAVAAPLYAEAATRASELNAALIARGDKLRESGYHEQVRVTENSCLLFSLAEGDRKALHLAGKDFLIDARRLPRQQLLDDIAARPELYSPNVLLRPVVQDYLLPTVTYFGGPGEIAYFAQGSVVHEKLLGRVTPVLPRLSATIVTGRQRRLLDRNALKLEDFFRGYESLREQMGRRALPQELQQELQNAVTQVESITAGLGASLRQLDPTLITAATRSTRKINYQINRLSARAARATLRRNGQLDSDAAELWSSLFPHKNLQERSIAGIALLAQHGDILLGQFTEAAAKHSNGHHLIDVI